MSGLKEKALDWLDNRFPLKEEEVQKRQDQKTLAQTLDPLFDNYTQELLQGIPKILYLNAKQPLEGTEIHSVNFHLTSKEPHLFTLSMYVFEETGKETSKEAGFREDLRVIFNINQKTIRFNYDHSEFWSPGGQFFPNKFSIPTSIPTVEYSPSGFYKPHFLDTQTEAKILTTALKIIPHIDSHLKAPMEINK